MEKTTSKKISVKVSAGKPLPGDKTLGIEPVIRVYAVEHVDDTEEGEGSYILVIHDSSLGVSKQDLVNIKFSYIGMFDHDRPTVVSAMCNLTSGVCENLDITSPMDVDQRVA